MQVTNTSSLDPECIDIAGSEYNSTLCGLVVHGKDRGILESLEDSSLVLTFMNAPLVILE
jgi:hypothetical protein